MGLFERIVSVSCQIPFLTRKLHFSKQELMGSLRMTKDGKHRDLNHPKSWIIYFWPIFTHPCWHIIAVFDIALIMRAVLRWIYHTRLRAKCPKSVDKAGASFALEICLTRMEVNPSTVNYDHSRSFHIIGPFSLELPQTRWGYCIVRPSELLSVPHVSSSLV